MNLLAVRVPRQVDGEVDTAARLDEKIAGFKKKALDRYPLNRCASCREDCRFGADAPSAAHVNSNPA
jgi:hypothetical protein